MAESEPIFVPGNLTNATTGSPTPTQPVTTQAVGPYDTLLNTGLTFIVVAFLLWWLAGKVGLTKGPHLHMLNQRKQALRELKTEYIKYLKGQGTKTNQRLYYGAVQIGKIKRLARLPYRIKLMVERTDPKTKKMVFKRDPKPTTGAFMVFEIIKKWPIGKWFSRWNDIYLIEEELVPEKSNDAVVVNQQVSFDIYFGIWISKGKVGVAQIDDSMWKYQNELLLSTLPSWAEAIAQVSPKTANEGATMEKEAKIEGEKRAGYVKRF